MENPYRAPSLDKELARPGRSPYLQADRMAFGLCVLSLVMVVAQQAMLWSVAQYPPEPAYGESTWTESIPIPACVLLFSLGRWFFRYKKRDATAMDRAYIGLGFAAACCIVAALILRRS
jgi:hypothetical protein